MPSLEAPIPDLRHRRRRNLVVVLILLLGLLLIAMSAWNAHEEARQRELESQARGAALLARIAGVIESDGIDDFEAEAISQAYFEVAYGGMEGTVEEPKLIDGYWRGVVRLGYAGTPDGEAILVNPRTGSITGPVLGTFKSLGDFRRFLATGGRPTLR